MARRYSWAIVVRESGRNNNTMTSDRVIEHIDKILKIGDIKVEMLIDADVWEYKSVMDVDGKIKSGVAFTIEGLHKAILNYLNNGDHDISNPDYEDNSNLKSVSFRILSTLSRDRQKRGMFCYPIWEEVSKDDSRRRRIKENGDMVMDYD